MLRREKTAFEMLVQRLNYQRQLLERECYEAHGRLLFFFKCAVLKHSPSLSKAQWREVSWRLEANGRLLQQQSRFLKKQVALHANPHSTFKVGV